jgi:hypothetical protein
MRKNVQHSPDKRNAGVKYHTEPESNQYQNQVGKNQSQNQYKSNIKNA